MKGKGFFHGFMFESEAPWRVPLIPYSVTTCLIDTLYIQQDVGGKITSVFILNVVTPCTLKINLLFWKEMVGFQPAWLLLGTLRKHAS